MGGNAHKKLLIVNDDPRNLFALTAALEEHGYEIIAAANGESAMAMLSSHLDVACVLVDLMMPGMDGYELTRRIRAHSRVRWTS